MRWDPSQYLKFAGHRLRPAIDLMNQIPAEAPAEIVDLGCGTGNVTRMLAQRWPRAAITGVDSSAEMLGDAAETLPAVKWQAADVATWRPLAPVEVLYSNAAFNATARLPGNVHSVVVQMGIDIGPSRDGTPILAQNPDTSITENRTSTASEHLS